MATMSLSLKSKEEQEQEDAAAKIQAIKRGNEARALVDLKKQCATSPLWVAAKAGDAAKVEALAASSADIALLHPEEGTALTVAVKAKQYEAAKVLVGYDAALGAPATELSIWQKVMADAKPSVNEEGEEVPGVEDPTADEYKEGLVTGLLAAMDPKEAGYLVTAAVKVGVYSGLRAPIPEEATAFDGMVGDKTGYGVTLSPGGDVYAGFYGAGGLREGSGALRTKEGTVYAGEWLAGKRHGKGSMTYADGGKYDGMWAYGKRHGTGTFTYANGDTYAGQWHAGTKHGEGKYAAKGAGCVYEGTWKHGAIVTSKVVMLSAQSAAYYGAFDKSGRPTGAGAFAYANGVTMAGTYDAPEIPEAEGDEPPVAPPSVWVGGACGTVEATTDASLKSSLMAVAPTLNVIIAGAPASGKGTQCEKIVEKYGLVHISTGDLLRAAAEDPENELGVIAKEKMEAGELVPDELITGILLQKIDTDEVKEKGFLLDGYPRTAVQAIGLEGLFVIPNKCILLDVPDEVLIARVTGRRKDPETGIIYHLTTKPPYKVDEEGNPVLEPAMEPPAEEGGEPTPKLDGEGNPVMEKVLDQAIMDRLEQRGDDTAEALTKRLQGFAANRDSVATQFKDIALTVDGNRAPTDVWADIDAFLSKA